MPRSTPVSLGALVAAFALAPLAPDLAAPAAPGPAGRLASTVTAGLAAQQPGPPPGAYDASPYMGQVRNAVVYGDIWQRPQLSDRDRSLVTVAVTQALYATDELRIHVGRALDNGVTQSEIAELIPHVLWYAGFPTGVNAARVATGVFEERGLPTAPPESSPRRPNADAEPEFPGALPATPYLTALLNEVLYAETWEREELSPRDRSLVTIAVNTALYRTDELLSHVRRGLDNGLAREEISEIITHVTWYAGFPAGVNAARAAARVFEARGLPLPDARFPGAPYLDTLIDEVLYGQAWERPELSPRDRSLATIASTQAKYQTDQLRAHLERGLDNGLTPEELSELVAHVTFYSGYPTGVNASRRLAEVFAERGIPLPEADGGGAEAEAGGAGAAAGGAPAGTEDAARDRVLELRTYTTHPGRLDALIERFRDHTRSIFERHGMESVGYWVPQDPPRSGNTLIYLLAHPSREAAEAAWDAFLDDPEWRRVREASVADGPIIESVERVYMDPTDFSGVR